MNKKILRATHGSLETPLKFGDLEIPCYVLEDGSRVLSQRGVNKALNRPEGGVNIGAEKTPSFLGLKSLKPFISNELAARIFKPIVYIPPHGGNPANGIPASVLPEICHVWIAARESGKLRGAQLETARKAEILASALAKVGIIALVDEATGYQKDRPDHDLQKFLALYLSEERLTWAKMFPDEYYKQLFRLRNWSYDPMSVKRPVLVGKLTNHLVYERLPEGVLEKLRELNPVNPDKKRRLTNHHQHMSKKIGQPDLRDHLLQLIAIMRASSNWATFKRNFVRAFPKPGDQPDLLPDED